MTPVPGTTSPRILASACTKTPGANWGTLSLEALIDVRRAYRSAPEEDHMKFVHVATRTKDLDSAIKFYEQLGLHEARRSELTKGKATLVFMEPEAGNFAIELVYNWGKDEPYDGGARFGHFAFDVEDLDAAYTELVAAGATDVGRPPKALEGAGPRIAFVADPDGNWIELIER